MADGSGAGKPNLVCGICLEQFKEPKILPCSHTFCLGCLEKTVKVQKDNEVEKEKVLPSEIGGAASATVEAEEVDQSIEELQEFNISSVERELDSKYINVDGQQKVASTVPFCPKMAFHSDSSDEESPSLSSEAVAADPPRQRVTVKCAVCAREHEVPHGEISQFETDCDAAQALEFDNLQKSATKPQSCGSCDEAKKLVSHCYECAASICKECTVLHAKLAGLTKHEVVPLNELTSEEYSSRRKKSHMCSRHNESVTYYCTPCARLICHMCFYEQHQGKRHRVLQLNEADRKLKEEVTTLSVKAKETGEVFQEYCKYIGKVELDVIGGEHAAGLKRKISEVFDQRIRQLQEDREHNLRKVEDHESMTKKEVWAAKDMITTVISNLEAGLRFMEKAQRCANPADRISMNSESSKILAKATKEKWSSHSLPRPIAISTSPSCSYQSPCGELVEITSNDVEIGNVTCDMGPFQREARVGRQVHIEISTKVDTTLPPTLQILYGKSKKVLEPIVIFESETSSNLWNVSFVPRCGGRHCIQVWIGGIEVASKDIDVRGMPRIGDKVKPGPDWNPPDEKNLYFEGTVARAKIATHKVYVNWKQSAGDGDEIPDNVMPQKKSEVFEDSDDDDVFDDLVFASLIQRPCAKRVKSYGKQSPWKDWRVEQEESLTQVVDQDLSSTQKFSVDINVKGDREATTETDKMDLEMHTSLLRLPEELIHREHKWGGPDGLYEVEVAL